MHILKSLIILLFFAIPVFVDAQEEETEKKGEPIPEKQQDAPSMQVLSKFDFVPGEQVLFFDDFSGDNIGDFPTGWNTNSSGEVVNLGGIQGKWLKMQSGGTFYPEIKIPLTGNFTFEFDLLATFESDPGCFEFDMYKIVPDEAMDALVAGVGGGAVKIEGHALSVFNWKEGNYGEISNSTENSWYAEHNKKKIHIAVAVQKQRMRLYVDAAKIFDIPRFFPEGINIDRIRFGLASCDQEGYQPFIGNLRVAVGVPDMRNKLISDGKMVTRGITFDTGSDKIKAESYGTLKEISGILKDNPSVRIKIVGYTDSDGDEASNLALSQKRAAAVKVALSGQFGIDGTRMETSGNGESQPVSPNTTPEGKANNRRVELIKL